jgi:ATP-dependent Clp protease ATP-binding subunit ClpA
MSTKKKAEEEKPLDYATAHLKVYESVFAQVTSKGSCFYSLDKPDPGKFIGREAEITTLYECLSKHRMKNVVLIGEAGCGKTMLVEELAQKIKNSFIVGFNVAAAVAGTKYRGQFEDRVLKALQWVKYTNELYGAFCPVILFIDEFHTFYKAGACEGAVSLSDIAKPFLSAGYITIIGATTPLEFEQTIKKDGALMRRMTPVYITEPGHDEVMAILRAFDWGQTDPTLFNLIYELGKAVPGAHNPDISIEILDRACARQLVTGKVIDHAMIRDIAKEMVSCAMAISQEEDEASQQPSVA